MPKDWWLKCCKSERRDAFSQRVIACLVASVKAFRAARVLSLTVYVRHICKKAFKCALKERYFENTEFILRQDLNDIQK